MSSFGVKGGIGTASRVAGGYTVGALVLSNFGTAGFPDLWRQAAGRGAGRPTEAGDRPGEGIDHHDRGHRRAARRAPAGRLSLRAGAGLARTGSVYGHGSAISRWRFRRRTPCRIWPTYRCRPRWCMNAARPAVRAAADSVEQAIVNALWHGETVHGRDGHTVRALRELLQELMA
jgi:D-aminopeptidase